MVSIFESEEEDSIQYSVKMTIFWNVFHSFSIKLV